jgi:predicted N-acyltransferase
MSETKEEKRFADLTNQEIVMIHDKFKTYLDELNSKLNKNTVHERIMTPMGEGIKVHKLTDEQVDEVKNTEFYQCSTSIVKKLGPIKDLIIDGAPDQVINITD